MSSIRVTTPTDATYFYSTTGPLPSNVDGSYEAITFQMDGDSVAINMYVANPPDQSMNWPGALQMAYEFISVFPEECGYPNLGADATRNIDGKPYLLLDYSESMDRISQGLGASDTAVVDFSVITSWSNIGSTLSQDEISGIGKALDEVKMIAAAAAEEESTNCAEAVDSGEAYTWPDGFTCTTSQCCSDHAPIYEAYVVKDELRKVDSAFNAIGIVASDIVKKHIYKFPQSGGAK